MPITMTVNERMGLQLTPAAAGFDGEHKAHQFKIVQPDNLNQYTCRAEIETSAGKSYHLIENDELWLTHDIAVRGRNGIQLVYFEGEEIVRKTSIANFWISTSINAVDMGAPEFVDGLAQLQASAFTAVEYEEDDLSFYNFAGERVDLVTLVGGGAGSVGPPGPQGEPGQQGIQGPILAVVHSSRCPC